jgi:glucose-1-phosphatase
VVGAVIFDLGGVLADFGGVGPMRELAGIDTDEEVWARWLACPSVRSFERGDCSAEDFAAGVVADWRLPITAADFLAGFRSWLTAPLPGADELVRAVQARVPVGCLSNTNRVHWEDRASRWPLVELFDHRFLSFELGMLKPDREVFEHVAAAIGLPPGRLLFLDDNLVNVEAARSVGFRAERVRGVEEARAALTAAGVIDATPKASSGEVQATSGTASAAVTSTPSGS